MHSETAAAALPHTIQPQFNGGKEMWSGCVKCLTHYLYKVSLYKLAEGRATTLHFSHNGGGKGPPDPHVLPVMSACCMTHG